VSNCVRCLRLNEKQSNVYAICENQHGNNCPAVPVSDDEDYGYSELPADISQSQFVETEVSAYLAKPDRSLLALTNTHW